MKRVLVLANNLAQASYRVRVAALLPLLRDREVDAVVRLRTNNPFHNHRLFASAGGYDAVLLQRKLLDPWEARVLRRHAKRIAYDVDDAVMFFNRPVGRVSRWRTARRFRATARAVDHVVAGNGYLAELFRAAGTTPARPAGPAATVLPTVVDPARYAVKRHAPTAAPRMVWIGSRSTLPYVRGRLGALAAAAGRVPGLGLVTVADATVDGAPFPVEHRPWAADTEAASLVAGDVGVAPTPSDPWTLGKCGFKIVQYMAAGLPVVASPVGANSELVTDGVTGFLPDTDAEWADAVARLAGDVDLRRRMGAAGRARVEAELCLDKVADAWAAIL
ncbi:MAG: mshA 8 [Phycisphaerales bacterium]|nr:mshA 8 [Phycisphaerales bacterium]